MTTKFDIIAICGSAAAPDVITKYVDHLTEHGITTVPISVLSKTGEKIITEEEADAFVDICRLLIDCANEVIIVDDFTDISSSGEKILSHISKTNKPMIKVTDLDIDSLCSRKLRVCVLVKPSE